MADDVAVAPLRRWEIPSRRRVIFAAHYSILGPEKAARIKESGRRWPKGGLDSPAWRADYELDLNATPGEQVITNWDPEKNIREMPVPKDGSHVLCFDYGASNSSYMACTATWIGPKHKYTYLEYIGIAAVAKHKARLRELIRQVRPHLAYDFPWKTEYHAIGDITGTGYRIEFAEEPWALHIMPPSTETNWRDRAESESILNGDLDVVKQCCFRRYDHGDEKCVVCDAELTFERGWLIHPRCENLRMQIPAQIMDDNGKRKEQGRDVFDTAMYTARHAIGVTPRLARKQEEPVQPWWLRPEVPEVSPRLEREVLGDDAGAWAHLQRYL